MIATVTVASDMGHVLAASLIESGPLRILAAFVTINTVMYGALAVAKMLPRVHPPAWLRRSNSRAEDRSINPAQWPDADVDDLEADHVRSGRQRVPGALT